MPRYLSFDELSAFAGQNVRIVRHLDAWHPDSTASELAGRLTNVFEYGEHTRTDRYRFGGHLIERYTSGAIDLSAVLSCELARCEGCSELDSEERPLSYWRVRYRGRGTDRPLYCEACGQLAAAGDAECILSAERATWQ